MAYEPQGVEDFANYGIREGGDHGAQQAARTHLQSRLWLWLWLEDVRNRPTQACQGKTVLRAFRPPASLMSLPAVERNRSTAITVLFVALHALAVGPFAYFPWLTA